MIVLNIHIEYRYLFHGKYTDRKALTVGNQGSDVMTNDDSIVCYILVIFGKFIIYHHR
jgi:hypothetical protein